MGDFDGLARRSVLAEGSVRMLVLPSGWWCRVLSPAMVKVGGCMFVVNSFDSPLLCSLCWHEERERLTQCNDGRTLNLKPRW